MNVESALHEFFSVQAPIGPGDRVVVAFSGGPDSLALAQGLRQLALDGLGQPTLCHIDHGLDPDSTRRATEAREIACQVGLPFELVVREVDPDHRARDGTEAAARHARYQALEQVRRTLGAKWIATAHHLDDQIETSLIRLLFGSGFNGLFGMASKRDRIIRPFLQLTRSELDEFLGRIGVQPVRDPTNFDLTFPRNRVRHLLLPALEASNPSIRQDIQRLAQVCHDLHMSIEKRVRSRIDVKTVGSTHTIPRSQLDDLPEPLRPTALAILHRAAGIRYPPRKSAVGDFLRQMSAGNRIGCDCGESWRWEDQGAHLALRQIRPPTSSFAYTLEVPGECELPELSLRFRIRQGPVAAWMFRHSRNRAALDLPVNAGDSVLLRNRRPGDRLTPLGCAYSKRLKDVLIDRRVPRHERSRLPLLFVDRHLAWVPGVTIDDSFRLTTGSEAWIAELEAM